MYTISKIFSILELNSELK